MAGNTRGKLKEQFEGVHRNSEWIKQHLAQSLILIKEHRPNLSDAIDKLVKGYETLDELAMNIYARL